MFLENAILYILLLPCFTFQMTQDVIKAGETQYQLLQERSNLPQYGSCWKQALREVHEGCNRLSEDTQSNIALQLTNCFLEMSGHDGYHCVSDRKPNLRKICISSMSDRAFNAYTEFYTHSQNICWFLRSQIWQEVIIERTYEVGKQLEASAENQGKLLDVQRESLAVQERALKHSQDLKDIVESVKSSIASSQEIILGIQNWLISEMSWFDTILFYILSLTFVFIFTSLRSSSGSRLPVLIILFSGVLSERFICQLFLAFNRNENANNSHGLLMTCIWCFRYTIVSLCVLIIIYTIFSYKNYEILNNKLLIEIRSQNEKLIQLLELDKRRSKNNSFNVDLLHENELYKQTSKLLETKRGHEDVNLDNSIKQFELHNDGGNSLLKNKNDKNSLYRSKHIEIKKYNLRSREATPQMI